MAWLVHLSDLHLLGNPAEQDTILRSLVHALGEERDRRGVSPDLMCLTGDVFDSSTLDHRTATRAFRRLLDEMHEALGGDVATVIVPGNHDRRRGGLFAPYDESLFDALRHELAGRAWVHGRDKPFLAEVVPPEVHGLPLWLVAYDSNHLPTGAIGAGGAIRQEDLLRAAAIINGHQPEWPVLFLLHHHLIPTPLTDLGPIEVDDAPRPVRWLIEHALPRLLANADREELFMTALGAGTALSTLHAMRRAVLVLHGHKHYATSRLLKGTQRDQGDVLIVSAGSAGTAQVWRQGAEQQSARLWPSFNAITFTDDRVDVEQVAFAWREVSGELARRPMVSVRRDRERWDPTDAHEAPAEPGPRLELNDSKMQLLPSVRFAGRRWDCEVRRRVRFERDSEGERYVEAIESAPGSELVLGACAVRVSEDDEETLSQIAIDPVNDTRYLLRGGVSRSVHEERELEGTHATPYGRVQLMNRYQCARAVLTLTGLGARIRTAFGSVTDLGTGLERPQPVEADAGADRVRIRVEDCGPRTLLRIYWLLEDPRLRGAVGVVPPAAQGASASASSSSMRAWQLAQPASTSP